MGCGASTPRSMLYPRAPRRRPVRRKPTKAELLKERADVNFFDASKAHHHGEHERALEQLTLALKLDPKHKRARLTRAEVCLALKKYDDALEDASQAIALGHPDAYRVRGDVHLARKRFRDALADLTIAVKVEPNDRRAWASRAAAHAGLGNDAKAKEDVAEAAKREAAKEDAGLCVVCIDEPRATRLNPCEHSALCEACATECRETLGCCPICNTMIKAIEYGMFMNTFAPTNTAALGGLASAIKRAREENAQMATLSRIGEGSPLMDESDDDGEITESSEGGSLVGVGIGDANANARAARGDDAAAAGRGDGGERAATPPPHRDYSQYTVGEDMRVESAPCTPAVLRGGLAAADGNGLSDLLAATPAAMGGEAVVEDAEDGEGEEEEEEDADGPTPLIGGVETITPQGTMLAAGA